MARALESDIDQLYQAPLADFTAERNALAKRAGAAAAEIRALQKPSVPAWAVNQLYWRKRAVYDELLARAHDLRATHEAAMRGKSADLRGAGRAHEDALKDAVNATLALLADAGQPATDATRQAIVTTLRALPSDDVPGRLVRQLQPRGFEALGGLTSLGRVKVAPPPAKTKPEAVPAPKEAGKDRAAKAAAEKALMAATRAARDAEQAARREEFEAARAARDLEKAERRIAAAQAALRDAQREMDDAQGAADIAEKARATVQARADKAADQLARAREHEAEARKALDAFD